MRGSKGSVISDVIFMVEQEPYLPTEAHVMAACCLIQGSNSAAMGGKGRPLDMRRLCALIQYNLDCLAKGIQPRATYADPKDFIEGGLADALGEIDLRWNGKQSDLALTDCVDGLNYGSKHRRYMRLAHNLAMTIASQEWQESIKPF